jgi:hypothetical protein
LPCQLTIAQAASPTSTQFRLLVIGAGVLLVIGPALALLYRLDQRSSVESPEA